MTTAERVLAALDQPARVAAGTRVPGEYLTHNTVAGEHAAGSSSNAARSSAWTHQPGHATAPRAALSPGDSIPGPTTAQAVVSPGLPPSPVSTSTPAGRGGCRPGSQSDEEEEE